MTNNNRSIWYVNGRYVDSFDSMTEAHKPELTPAQIRRSFTPDAIMSFEDGRSYKSLRPHLAKIGLSPNEYREKWGLPRDYPMVAENYSRQCRERATTKRLGIRNNLLKSAK